MIGLLAAVHESGSGTKRRLRERKKMSAIVEGFGCRPMATMRLAPGPASESLGRN